MAELPLAQLTALTANINRDPKKSQAFQAKDFCIFKEDRPEAKGQLPPEAAAVALDLHHQKRLPPILLCAWQEVLKSAKEGVVSPEVKALHSDDEKVWVLAPSWEGTNIRGALVAVHGQLKGAVKLRDLDRPLAVYEVVLPEREKAGWLEAGLLLASA